MFLEWENNSGKLQIISGKYQNNAITTSNRFDLAIWLYDKDIAEYKFILIECIFFD